MRYGLETITVCYFVLTFGHSEIIDEVRIANGTRCDVYSYPFYISLLIEKNNKTILCDGSILEKNAVLTTASCCNDSKKISVFNNEQRDISSQYIIHPQYEPSRRTFNLCVVKLSKGFELTEKTQLVKLADAQTFAEITEGGRLIDVMGYVSKEVTPRGTFQCTGAISLKLADCYKHILGVNMLQLVIFDTESMFCAVPNANQGFVCGEDLGGPAMFNGIQVGVTSRALTKDGNSCDRGGTIFSRIDDQTDFILKAINTSNNNEGNIVMFAGIYLVVCVLYR